MDLILKNQPLDIYNSWAVGGKAEYFCLPTTFDELKAVVSWAQERAVAITLLGGGSNVLISDQGIPGLTICFKNYAGIETQTESEVVVLAGTNKSELLKFYLGKKLAPALFLAGIPGEVGGGVVMNAGVAEAYSPREFCEIVNWVEVLKPDMSLKVYKHSDIQWSYRHSLGWQPGIITRVGLSAKGSSDTTILNQVKEANRNRLAKQPLDMPSCGSVFRNPKGHKAAQLIDSCGLKGFAIGGAQVSLKHANFIVNTGQATADEMWRVILHVQGIVLQQKQIQLQTEVVRLGHWSDL